MSDATIDPPTIERRQAIRDGIVAWFRDARRSLPFRDDPTPYRVWVSEVMAQQTRIDVVVPYFERFVARFPSVAALADGPLDDVLALWSGLGYYSRARNLHAAAKAVVEEHEGQLPKDPAELRRLPGIGPYTAGAIASIAYGVPVPALDGNVIRVLARLFDVDGDVTRGPVKRRLHDLARSLVPPRDPRSLNEGLMELGALICTPTSPSCGTCPVAPSCLARERGTVEQRPAKRPKTPPKPVRALAAVVTRPDGSLLLVRNPRRGLFGGLWQLPLVELADGTTGRSVSDLVERAIGAPVTAGERLGEVVHVLSHRRLSVEAHRCTVERGDASPPDYDAHRWIAEAGELDSLGVATLTRKLLALAEG